MFQGFFFSVFLGIFRFSWFRNFWKPNCIITDARKLWPQCFTLLKFWADFSSYFHLSFSSSTSHPLTLLLQPPLPLQMHQLVIPPLHLCSWRPQARKAFSLLQHPCWQSPGPNLIHRILKDKLTPPIRPENNLRPIGLLDKSGTTTSWARTAFGMSLLQMATNIMVTSGITIRVRVQKDTTTSNFVFASSQDILSLLMQCDINNVEVAFYDSEAQLLISPLSLVPIDMNHLLKT